MSMSASSCGVSRPALVYPEHRMSQAEMLAMAKRVYGDRPHLPLIERMIANTQIASRYLALGPDELGRPLGLAARTRRYMELGLPLARRAVREGLERVALEASDIDLIITTSCTSFVMPSLDAYLINELGFRADVRRMPLAQLGCVAGVSALLAASDHCRAYPEARVLIVALELSSLCFFPREGDLSSAVCASIFGDGAAACVVSGAAHRSAGLRLHGALSHTVAHSEHFIRYEVLDAGFHLRLDRGVMHVVPKLAPVVRSFTQREGIEAIEFVVAHTGGRRILDSLGQSLELPAGMLDHSRASLREAGNTASVSVFDVLERAYAGEPAREGASPREGLVIGFGPGFTMALLSASWWPREGGSGAGPAQPGEPNTCVHTWP